MPQLVVVDTNVLISAALLPASVSARALLFAVEHYQLVQSEATWAEFCEVISRTKFDRYLSGSDKNNFLLSIARASEFVDVTVSVNDCSDPKDNKFLELAMSVRASIIVSGDVHLQEMHPYNGITILNPQGFFVLNK